MVTGGLSLWTDVMSVSGPASPFLVRANAFSIATGSWVGDPDFESINAVSRGPFSTDTNDHLSVNFQVDVDFLFDSPAPQRFGVYGSLVAQGGNGWIADLGNTASLDAIVLPAGYSIRARGVALGQDVQGRFLYGVAAVPEPQAAAMLSAGLLALAILRRRRSL